MALTTKEILSYLDKEGLLNVDRKLGVCVKCVDVREAYGRLDVQVEPLQGTGKLWVSEARIAWTS